MRMTAMLTAFAIAAISHIAHANEDPLAPAKAGKLWCYEPNSENKTCNSFSRFEWDSAGTIWENEGRSINLSLTPKGSEALKNDPLAKFSKSLDDLSGKTRRRLAKGLADLLETDLKRREQPSFGTCPTCSHFREKGDEADGGGPHSCMYFDVSLSSAETQLICVAHS